MKYYVDVIDDKLVAKIVNETNDPKSEKHRKWEYGMEDLKTIRSTRQERWTHIGKRRALEPNGEMALYFVITDTRVHPNREALKFHKTACLIWRMAGGAESEEEFCPNDDDDDCRVSVDYQTKNIEKWMDASATIIIDNAQ